MPAAFDPPAVAAADNWVIEPEGTGVAARARDLWRYRRLLWFLAVRNVKETYEGMTLGIFWLFARPLFPILVGGFVFGGLLGLPSDGVPYTLFFMTGFIPWSLFQRSVLFGTRCLDNHRNLIKRLYFPRLISPVASLSTAATYFVIYMVLLALLALFYLAKDGMLYVRVEPRLLVAPLISVFIMLCALSVVLFTAVVQARHKETRFGLRYVLQFWMYLTPVFYPISVVPPEHRWLIYVNPLASVVATFRWSILGVGEVPLLPLATSFVVVVAALTAGVWFFTASEASTVDQL